MESLVWYNSHIIDAYRQDESVDQSDINTKWYYNYKCDSIINKIGKTDLSYVIDFFLKEIEEQSDFDQLRAFYKKIFFQINEVFNLMCLEDFALEKKALDFNKEVKKLLLFFSKDYKNFLINILYPIFDPKKNISEQYIKKNFNIIEKYFKNLQNIPFLIKYFLIFDSTENRINLLWELCKIDFTYINAELIILYLKEMKND